MTFKGVLRNIFFLAVTVTATAWAATTVIFFKWIGASDSFLKRIEYLWAIVVVWAAGLEVEAKLHSKIQRGIPYVFISNHQSYLDIPVLVTVLKDFSPRFVAKSSLFKIPIFGPAMRAVAHVPIDRDNQKKGLRDLKKAIERAKRGESILIFPEGTRNPSPQRLLEFHTGAFILAIRSNCALVPVVLHGTGEILPRGTLWLARKRKKVKVNVLSPVHTRGINIKERDKLKEKLWNIMQKEFVEITHATR